MRLSLTLTLSPLHDLVIWTDGYGVLANCSLYGTEATLSFSVGPVCSTFSAKACAILQAHCWSRQHQQECHFSSLLLPTLLHLFFCLNLFNRSGRNCLLTPVLSGYNWSQDTRFFREMTWLISWPHGERYLRPPQSLAVSLLLSLVSTLFSDWRRTVSSKFDTQVF